MRACYREAMRLGRIAIASALASAAGFAACVSTGDLSGGAGAESDGSADVTPDAADAPGDVGADGDAGGAVDRCHDGKPHDFCDDFEDITGFVEDRWNKRKEVVGTGELVTLVAAGAPSPVTVLRSTTHRGLDGGNEVHIARLSKQDSPWARTDSGAQPGVRLATEVYFDRADEYFHNMALLGTITGNSAELGEDGVSLNFYDNDAGAIGFFIEEVYGQDGGVQYGSKQLPMTVAYDTWTHVEVEIQERAVGVGGGGMNVTIGTRTDSYTLKSSSRVPYFRADFGLGTGSYAGAEASVYFDDIKIDYKP
jgi:hypothetical protein